MNKTVNESVGEMTKYSSVRQCLLGMVMLACLPMISQAATTVTVKVTVVKPPCTVNGNKPIEVDFGDVMTTRIDGSNYRQPVNYTLSCTGGDALNAMKLQVQGNVASFDATALGSDQAGLAVRLQNGTTTLPVNSWLNFNYPSKPALWAVPVMKIGATLTGGMFTAAATLNVDYQ